MVSITLILLSACNDPVVDKNQQIINLIKNMESNIEAKKVDDFMDALDKAIVTDNGWHKKDIERLIRLRLMRRTSVHIHTQLKQLDWHNGSNEQAQATLIVAMAGTEFSLTDLARINADLIRFQVTFKRDGDNYVASKVSWQRARPMDFL